MDKMALFPVPLGFKNNSWCDAEKYKRLYKESIEAPEKFWGREAKRLDWISPWAKVKDCSFSGDVHIRWFIEGKINASYNCMDRHLPKRADQTAIIWEPDDPNEQSLHITYRELHDNVCKLSNALKKNGVKKGDRVTIYLPMIPEAIYSMLACARIGAIHSVVFGGFSPDSLENRILDCDSQFVITADEGVRAGKIIPIKRNVDLALDRCKGVKKVFVVKRTGAKIDWNPDRDIWYHEAIKNLPSTCKPEIQDSEDPLFILYTSGSTGKPKGVLHTTGGYLVFVAMTHQYTFDYRDGDIFWCTADIGWITGHSYLTYGPLANGATVVMFEGTPIYPTSSRHWEIVDKHKVTIYYTAPTAIRSLMRDGDEPVKKTSRKTLRILGTVGEPINPEAWLWYYEVVGEKRCPIVDTWWQTETGGILISPLPGATDLKPGSATVPFFGIKPVILDPNGKEIEGEGEGALYIADCWPAQMRTVYKNHQKFIETYFTEKSRYFYTGDGCRRDKDGYYWITGRVDDVINVSGHRIGTAEIESALDHHHDVIESAVVGYPHPIKGQGIYAYVTLGNSKEPSEALRKELIQHVRKIIGPIASPDLIQWTSGLPKTRSGKIMRRILRKIAEDRCEELGDTSTLANPQIVEELIESRMNKAIN